MAKSREEVQDIALYHMEKLSRSVGNVRENKILSLADQIAIQESGKRDSQPEMNWFDWLELIFKNMKSNRQVVSHKAFEYVVGKYKSKLESYKSDSRSREAAIFIDEHSIEWMNA